MTKRLFLLCMVLLCALCIMVAMIVLPNLQQMNQVEQSTSVHDQTQDASQTENQEVENERQQETTQEQQQEVNIDASLLHDPNSLLVIVNKKYPLEEQFEPSDLVEPDVVKNGTPWMLRKEAADALQQMFEVASQQGVTLKLGSGYRSYTYQGSLYQNYVSRHGQEKADTFSARPGYSEHQTGLAADILGSDPNTDFSQSFGETIEGQWLFEHAVEFGFILRYPKGYEEITGYQYEPWHFRYLGKEQAQKFKGSGLPTLEQYFQVDGGDYES